MLPAWAAWGRLGCGTVATRSPQPAPPALPLQLYAETGPSPKCSSKRSFCHAGSGSGGTNACGSWPIIGERNGVGAGQAGLSPEKGRARDSPPGGGSSLSRADASPRRPLACTRGAPLPPLPRCTSQGRLRHRGLAWATVGAGGPVGIRLNGLAEVHRALDSLCDVGVRAAGRPRRVARRRSRRLPRPLGARAGPRAPRR